MDVRRIDSRDTEWEIPSPPYRLHFWRQLAHGGYTSEEFELRGAVDVREVLRWGR